MQQVNGIDYDAGRLPNYRIRQVVFVKVHMQAASRGCRLIQRIGGVRIVRRNQSRQLAGNAINADVAGQLDPMVGADGFDGLRECAPRFFRGLQKIAIVQAEADVPAVMRLDGTIGCRVRNGISRGQRGILTRGVGGADGGGYLCVGKTG